MAVFLTRLAVAFAALVIASVAFVGALGFLCYSIFLAFALVMPGFLAAIATTVFLIAFAVMVLMFARNFITARQRPRRQQPIRPPGIVELEALLGIDLTDYAQKNPYLATGIAFLVGILFGVSPGLRRAAGDILRQ
jgi:hypothetical protein